MRRRTVPVCTVSEVRKAGTLRLLCAQLAGPNCRQSSLNCSPSYLERQLSSSPCDCVRVRLIPLLRKRLAARQETAAVTLPKAPGWAALSVTRAPGFEMLLIEQKAFEGSQLISWI